MKRTLPGLLEPRIYVYDDGGIVGYGAVHGSEIRALFVHPLARGGSIGKRLLERLLLDIQGSARWYVAKANTAANNLYRRYGFTVSKAFETIYNGQSILASEMVRSEA